jgi:hypothetical protein
MLNLLLKPVMMLWMLIKSSSQSSSSTEEASPVTLVVMGLTHCAFDDCTEELKMHEVFFVHAMK